MRPGTALIWAIALLATTAASQAQSQELCFVIDSDTPAASVGKGSPAVPLEISPGLAFCMGYTLKSPFLSDKRLRWGVNVGIRSLRVNRRDSPSERYKYSEFRMQWIAHYDLFETEGIVLSCVLGLGGKWVTDSVPCNTMFCDFPEFGLIATPSVRANIALTSKLSVICEYKYPAYLNDSGATYPFKSGSVFGIGIGIGAWNSKQGLN